MDIVGEHLGGRSAYASKGLKGVIIENKEVRFR